MEESIRRKRLQRCPPRSGRSDGAESMKSDIEIAQEATLIPMTEVAAGLGLGAGRPRPLRQVQGQDPPGRPRPAEGPARRQAGALHRHHSHSGRRRQDHHQRRSLHGPQQDRQEGDRHAARALAGPVLRHQGRSGRRRVRPGGPHGGHQPPLHRRHPRHHHGPQPVRGRARQPSVPGQRAQASTPTTSPGRGWST